MPAVVEIQATPNPNAAKFTLDRVIAAQGTTYRPPAAGQPDWAARLLGIAGVTQVFALNTFITVTKAADGDWNTIAPQVERTLNEALA